MSQPEIYVSTDVETDGPIPGVNSLRHMPKHWFDPAPHTHQALDDAIEQGALFCTMLQENLTR